MIKKAVSVFLENPTYPFPERPSTEKAMFTENPYYLHLISDMVALARTDELEYV